MKKLNVQKAEENLKSLMDASVAQNHTLGGICLIHQDGKPVLEVVSGKATIDGKDLTSRSIFRLASMSKNICGIAVMQLIEQGKLSLDTKIADFYPGFANKWIGKRLEDGSVVADRKSEVALTLKHMVTHTNGIGTIETRVPETKADLTLEKLSAYYANEALLDFEPGTRWGYSGLAAFDVMGNIIEKLTDMPYEDYVKKYITDPLEMEDTGFTLNDRQMERMVDVLSHDAQGKNIVTEVEKNRIFPLALADYPAPGGGMASTAADYIRINDMLVNEGTYQGVKILSADSVKQMRTPLIPQGMPGIFFPWMTFGVCVYVRKGVENIEDGCFGWGGYYGTYTWTDPKNKLGVVWMKNSNVLASVIEPTGERAFEKAVYDAME